MEIDQLISYLINKENSEGVVLLGHSTGCQVVADFVLNLFCIQSLCGCSSMHFSEVIRVIVYLSVHETRILCITCAQMQLVPELSVLPFCR